MARLAAVLIEVTESARPKGSAAGRGRVDALTGLRAVAALLVLTTHAAFATGTLTNDFFGSAYARLEVGVAIFFALSGFLLFRPWVRAAAADTPPPRLPRYARHRIRRIMPPYIVAVLATFAVYVVFTPGPNPGQTWTGLVRHLTLTQIYTHDYLTTLLHPGLSQMWSLAVEVAFYAILPLLAYLLLTVLCGGRWHPRLLLAALAGLAAVPPAWLLVTHGGGWLPNSAGMWLPAHLGPFLGGMALAVLQRMGMRVSARAAIPAAALAFLAACTPIAGGTVLGADEPLWTPVAKAMLYTVVATLLLAPLVLGDDGWLSRILGSRPMVWLGEISYEIFLLQAVVMAVTVHAVLQWPLFTGSLTVLCLMTLAITVPLAWLLRQLTQTRSRNAGNNRVSARPRCEAASFSVADICAADRVEPVGMKIGS